MHRFIRFPLAVLTLLFSSWQSFGQTQRGTGPEGFIQSNQHFDSSIIQKLLPQNPARSRWKQGIIPSNKPTSGTSVLPDIRPAKKSQSLSVSQILGAPGCQDTSGRILTTENGEYFAPEGSITKLGDGNILVPGFHQQTSAPYYYFPDLVKYDPVGNIIWSKAYCLKDPVTLQAPGGYNQYFWRTNNNTNTYNTRSFTVFPPVTTQYFASAQTTLGCIVKDSILITINVSNPIYLGSDTSFCAGDSILLNAGTGFLNYNWNTGASAAAVWVQKQGIYSVKAQSTNGCYSSDTLAVKKLFSLPKINLDQSNFLCEGGIRTLNAGNGCLSYVWQDRSGSSTLKVDTTGTYWVQVKDNNGCVAGDTVFITQIIPKSSGFLPIDTLICDGYPSKIQAAGQFS